jgi:pSer/pThr/pTyr-binding forkhead associated (FHA) protein
MILYFLAGGLAGLLAWLSTEFLAYFRPILFFDVVNGTIVHPEIHLSGLERLLGIGPDKVEAFRGRIYVAIFGVWLGLLFGAVASLSRTGRPFTRQTLFYLLALVPAGWIASWFAGLLYGAAGGDPTALVLPGASFFDFFQQVFARGLGYGGIGAILGLAQGIPGRSVKAAYHGLLGGAIGGTIGGMLFEIAGTMRLTAIGMSHLIGLVLIGAFIGFFIALIADLLKAAWVRVVAGRNEGKEIVIDRKRMSIGRDELCDIPLFGDPAIARRHADIFVANTRYMIQDMGSGVGTIVNGQKVSSAGLKDGDEIRIGSIRLRFFEKATAARFGRPKDQPSALAPDVPVDPNRCPFCGEVKDAAGRCSCTVVAVPGQGPPPQSPPYEGGEVAGAARLVIVEGPHAGSSFDLPHANITIGRQPGRDIVLSGDSVVSRTHARIEYAGGAYFVTDEGSTNGTFVNDRRISRQILAPGDVIQVGATKLRFDA